MVKELEAQVKGLIELQRIKSAKSVNATIMSVSRVAIKALSVGLGGI